MGCLSLQWNQRIVKPGIEGLHFLRRFQASCQSIFKNPMIDQFDHRAKIQFFLAKFMKNPQLTFPTQRFGRGWYHAGKAGISPKFSWWKSDKSWQGFCGSPFYKPRYWRFVHTSGIGFDEELGPDYKQPGWLTRGSRNVQRVQSSDSSSSKLWTAPLHLIGTAARSWTLSGNRESANSQTII